MRGHVVRGRHTCPGQNDARPSLKSFDRLSPLPFACALLWPKVNHEFDRFGTTQAPQSFGASSFVSKFAVAQPGKKRTPSIKLLGGSREDLGGSREVLAGLLVGRVSGEGGRSAEPLCGHVTRPL